MVKIRQRITKATGKDFRDTLSPPTAGESPTAQKTGPMRRVRMRRVLDTPSLIIPPPLAVASPALLVLSASDDLLPFLDKYPLGEILTSDDFTRLFLVPLNMRFFSFLGRKVAIHPRAPIVRFSGNLVRLDTPLAILRHPDLHSSLWPKVSLPERRNLWGIKIQHEILARKIPADS